MNVQVRCIECNLFFTVLQWLHTDHLCPTCAAQPSRCLECQRWFKKEPVLVGGAITLADYCGRCRVALARAMKVRPVAAFLRVSGEGETAGGALPYDLYRQVAPPTGEDAEARGHGHPVVD